MSVHATTRKSYRDAAQVLAHAFMDEPVSQRIYHGLSEACRLKNLQSDFTGELAVCTRRGNPLEIRRNGSIVASAVIYPPGAYPLSWLDQKYIQASAIFGHTRYDRRAWQAWLEATEIIHPLESHYYLEYLGVEPGLQGQGLGSRLLAELVSRADQTGAGCYLETATQRNLPLYQRFGFQVTLQKEIIGLPAWFMWRPTRKPPRS